MITRGSLHFLHSRQENPLRKQPQSVSSPPSCFKYFKYWVTFTERKRKERGGKKVRNEGRKEGRKTGRVNQGGKGRRKLEKKEKENYCAAEISGTRGNLGHQPGLLVHKDHVLSSLCPRNLPLWLHHCPLPLPVAARNVLPPFFPPSGTLS